MTGNAFSLLNNKVGLLARPIACCGRVNGRLGVLLTATFAGKERPLRVEPPHSGASAKRSETLESVLKTCAVGSGAESAVQPLAEFVLTYNPTRRSPPVSP